MGVVKATTIDDAVFKTGVAFRFADAGTAMEVTATGSLTSLKNIAVYSAHQSNTVYIDGTVHADNAAAIAMFGDHANVQIRVGGVVSSDAVGATVASLYLGGPNAVLNDAGSISALACGAVEVTSVGGALYNSGDIMGANFGVFLVSAGANLSNSGTINATSGNFNWGAVRVFDNDAHVWNGGTIAAYGADVAGVLEDVV